MEALIAEIDRVLQQLDAANTDADPIEIARQRRVLEQFRQYLSDRAAGDAAEVSAWETAAGDSPEAALRTIAEQIIALHRNLLQPLGSELATLRQERQTLIQEITDLDRQRQQETISQVLDDFRDRLLDRVSERIDQVLTGVEAQSRDEAIAASDSLPGSSAPLLTPQQRLDRLQQLHNSADRLLIELDTTLTRTFSALQGNVRSYERSLSEGMEKLHGLGQQSQARLIATVDDLIRTTQEHILSTQQRINEQRTTNNEELDNEQETASDELTDREAESLSLSGDRDDLNLADSETEVVDSISLEGSTPSIPTADSAPSIATPISTQENATPSTLTSDSTPEGSTPLTPTEESTPSPTPPNPPIPQFPNSQSRPRRRTIAPLPEPEPLDIWEPTDINLTDTDSDLFAEFSETEATALMEDAAADIESELSSSAMDLQPTSGESEYDEWFEEFEDFVVPEPEAIAEVEAPPEPEPVPAETVAEPIETEVESPVESLDDSLEVEEEVGEAEFEEIYEDSDLSEETVEEELDTEPPIDTEEVVSQLTSDDIETDTEEMDFQLSGDDIDTDTEDLSSQFAEDEFETDTEDVASQLSEEAIADATEPESDTEDEDNTASDLHQLMSGETEVESDEDATEDSNGDDGNFIDIDIYEALLDPDRFTEELQPEEPEPFLAMEPEPFFSQPEPEAEADTEYVEEFAEEEEDFEAVEALLNAESLAEETDEEVATVEETIAASDRVATEPEYLEEPEEDSEEFEADDFEVEEETEAEVDPTDDDSDPLAAFDLMLEETDTEDDRVEEMVTETPSDLDDDDDPLAIFDFADVTPVPTAEASDTSEDEAEEDYSFLEIGDGEESDTTEDEVEEDFSFLEIDDEEEDDSDREPFPTSEMSATDDSDPLAAFDFYTEEEDDNDDDMKAMFGGNDEGELSQELLPDIELDRDASLPVDPPSEIVPEPRDWYLGIDLGTTGTSAVLLHYSDRKLYPISWQQEGEETNRDRVPSVAYAVSETEPPRAVSLEALSLASLDAEVPGASPGVLLNNFKTFLEIALPWQDEEGVSQPILHYSERQEIPIVQWRRSLQALLATLKPNPAAGESETFNNTAIPPLAGVIVSIPTNASVAYRFNVREAVLAAELVSQPDRVFLLEESVASVLSFLPDSEGESPSFAGDDRGRQFQLDRWQGTTLVLSCGAENTEFCIARVPENLADLDRDRIFTYRFPYGGNDLDRDIIFHLLLDENFARELPLSLPDGIELPKPGEPDGQSRILFDRWLQTSPLRLSLLDIAKHVKIALQSESEFTFPFGDRRLTVKRQDLERRVLLPFAQKLNRELNVFLSQTGVAVEAIDRAICTGGTSSWSAISRWLRQKLPNGTIVCDTYPNSVDRDRSRVAYGLAMLPLHPQVLEVTCHQYNDLFLLRELLQAFPGDTASSMEIMAALDRRGINTKACQTRIANLLAGQETAGLLPNATEAVFFTETSLNHPAIATLTDTPLFTVENKHTYRLDPQQRQQWLQHIDRVLASCRQTLEEPLTAAIVHQTASLGGTGS